MLPRSDISEACRYIWEDVTDSWTNVAKTLGGAALLGGLLWAEFATAPESTIVEGIPRQADWHDTYWRSDLELYLEKDGEKLYCEDDESLSSLNDGEKAYNAIVDEIQDGDDEEITLQALYYGDDCRIDNVIVEDTLYE